MTTFRNDRVYRRILKAYRACFQEIHKQVQFVNEQFLARKPITVSSKRYMMDGLYAALVQAGLRVEKVGDFQDEVYDEELAEGFFLVEDRFLVGTAFLQRLKGYEIRVYLQDHCWTDIHAVLLNFESEEPDWYASDKSWPEPTWLEGLRGHVKSLDEPDEYWLYMLDPDAYNRIGNDDFDA